MNRLTRSTASLIALSGLLAVAACGADYRAQAGNVAALVNGKEIAVRQPAGETQGTPGAAAFATLNELIDRELLVQKALDKQLDQDSRILNEIEAARREILARAYVDRNMPTVNVDALQIRDYYKAHPALYAERRLYRLAELITTDGPGQLAELQARINEGSTMEQLANWLRNHQRATRRVAAVRTSDQIPPAALGRIDAMTPGDIAVFENRGRISIIQLLQVQDTPLTLAEATPAIEHSLIEQKRQAFIRTTASQLRTGASVEYLGAFADPQDKRPSALANGDAAASADDRHLAKGLSGLL